MVHRFGDCELDTARRELRRAGVLVPVEPQVFELLAYLLANPNRVVSKDELNTAIWSGRAVSDSALSSRIKSARQAIGDDGKTQSLIRTVHGAGFRFVGDIEQGAGAAANAVPLRERPIVAVIPFENLSGDPSEEYVSEGVTADIIATLAKHRWLAVLSRHATSKFKGAAVDISEIARETGAHYVVEGSVRRAGDRVRVSVQLIDAHSRSCIWSEQYDRQSEDIFEIQDDIAQTISARVEPEIGYEERRKIKTVGSRDLRAWEWFHLGIAHLFKFTGPDNAKAQEYLGKARAQDSDFPEAQAWWAYAVVLGTVYWDTDPSPEMFDEALQATSRALEADPRNAVLYALKARVQLARGDYDDAIEGNRAAIELNPSFAAAHCGLADSLTYLGHCDEAVERFEKAIALSTNDPQRWAFYTYGALAHIFRGDYERAIDWADHAIAIPNRQFWSLAHKAVALALLGRRDEARDVLAKARMEQPALSVSFARRKLYYLKRADQLDRYVQGLALAGAPA